MGAQCGPQSTACCISDGDKFGEEFPAVYAEVSGDVKPHRGAIEIVPVKRTLLDSPRRNDSYEPFDDDAAVANLAKPSANYFASEPTELLEAILDQSKAPIWRFKNGSTYEGEWLGSKRHGFGTQVWPDGTKYQGQWKDNLAEGVGRFTHSDGDEYVGSWVANSAHGLGVYRSKCGNASYEGEWISDAQTGFGVELWDDGSWYEGEFKCGQKHGYGVYTWSDGDIYFGVWECNNFHGAGTHTTSQGCCFTGTWNNSVIHGHGQYTWSDGRSFRGQYKLDKRDGFGVFQWPDSSKRYSGYWRSGQQHGSGEYINEKGIRKMQVWHDGVEVNWKP